MKAIFSPVLELSSVDMGDELSAMTPRYHFLKGFGADDGCIAIGHVVLIIWRHLIDVLFHTAIRSLPYKMSVCWYFFTWFNPLRCFIFERWTTMLSLLFLPTNIVITTAALQVHLKKKKKPQKMSLYSSYARSL